MEHLEKSELEHIRPGAEHVVEGAAERSVILVRQPCDEIHMQMTVSGLAERGAARKDAGNVPRAADGAERLRIRRLHPGLKLKQPRPRLPDERERRVGKKFGFNLKVKIRHTVVMFQKISKDRVAVRAVRVERTIDKFDLGNAGAQKNAEAFARKRRGHEAHAALARRQAVAA